MKGWIHVFRTGEWTDSAGNTRTWNEADLDEIVSKFNAESEDVPLCVGHPKHDSPAYGWVDKIVRQGKDLWVKPKQIMKEFLEAVRDGRYKKISIALRPDLTLRHIGFLGGAAPAVKGLKPMDLAEGEFSIYEFAFKGYEDEEMRVVTFTAEENDMNELEKLKAELAKKEQAYKDLEGKYEEGDQKRKQAEENLKSLRMNMRKMEYESYLNEYVAYGQLNEEQQKQALAILEVLSSATFSDLPVAAEFAEFKDGKKTPVEVFKDFLKPLPKKVEFAEVATADRAANGGGEPAGADPEHQFTEGKKNVTVDQASMDLYKKASKRQKEKGITFREAVYQIREEEANA